MMFTQRERQALDRHITGNYGEDQFKGQQDEMFPEESFICQMCGKDKTQGQWMEDKGNVCTDCLQPDQPHKITDTSAALAFILAGNAYFTIRSQKTGTRYTYRVSLNKSGQRNGWKPMHFVSLLTGPQNTTDYTYLGAIRTGLFYLTRASQMNEQSTPVRAFRYLYEHLTAKKFPADLELWHEGRCGRCGRKLTVPESVERGIGPECASITGGGQ